MKNIKNILDVFFKGSFKDKHIFFGILMSINYPIFYCITHGFNINNHYIEIILRSIASFLCITIVFKNFWPNNIKKYFDIYFFACVTYCLPFFFSFFLILNNHSPIWLMNCVSAVFFMLLILEIRKFFISLFIGIFLGVLFFNINYSTYEIPNEFYEIITSFFAAIIIGSLFSHNNYITENEKIKSMKTIAGNIAHEMRTPLSGVLLGSNVLKNILPELIDHYKKSSLTDKKIPYKELDETENIPDYIISLTNSGLIVIDMLLAKLKEKNYKKDFTNISAISVIKNSVKKYPFLQNEKDMLQLNLEDDFIFHGNNEMIQNVIFNLLKNSIYFISVSGKGSIFISISTDEDEKYNLIKFKDTGTGINPRIAKNLFKRFYSSNNTHGTGLGLSFCKDVMLSFNGDITCNSIYGEYAEFILKFPKINI